jgi:hypothetical protein
MLLTSMSFAGDLADIQSAAKQIADRIHRKPKMHCAHRDALA